MDCGAGLGARVHGRHPKAISVMGGAPGPALKSTQENERPILGPDSLAIGEVSSTSLFLSERPGSSVKLSLAELGRFS